MGLVDDEETVAVGLANPGFEGLAVSAQLALHFVDLVAEGRIRREVIELGDHAVRNLLQTIALLSIRPVLGILLDALEHLEVATTRALLGLQKSCRIDLDARHVEELVAKGLLHGRRGDDEHLLVLKLGAKDVFLSHLDGGTGLARSGSVDDEDIARGSVRRQDTTQKALMGLERKASLGGGTGFVPKVPKIGFRGWRERRGGQFR